MDRRTMTTTARGSHGRRYGRRLAALAGAAGLTLALLAPGAVSAATPATIDPATTDPGCPGHWPAAVKGVPATYHAGAKAGDYLWHDSRGWHLRVTKKTSERAVFTGRITADAPMTVRGAFLEREDSITLSNGGRTLTYRFVNHGHLDGIDIRTACASRLTVTGSMDYVRLPASRVWIGAGGAHPLGVPFAILRVP